MHEKGGNILANLHENRGNNVSAFIWL